MPPVEIIAEIGTSHQGDLVKARELIAAAGESGAMTVKFQWVHADEIIHPLTGDVPLPGGKIPLFQRFQALEQGVDFYAALKEHAESLGLRFLCTPFGIRSAAGLHRIGADRYKIASPELNHLPLLEYVGASNLPLIISSGVSRLSDIEEALATIQRVRRGHFQYAPEFFPQELADLLRSRKEILNPGQPEEFRQLHPALKDLEQVVLLHCITSYPAPEDQYNLLLIPALQGIFGIPVGISDHSLDPLLVPLLTAILGGCAIEKHFTLSRQQDGLDDPIALEPRQFARMSAAVRAANQTSHETLSCGPCVSPETATQTCCQVLGDLGHCYPEDQIRRILGSGIKVMAEAEHDNYGRTNRSIHALTDLPAGTVLGPHNFALLRTEKVLRPGLHPRYASILVGRKTACHVPSGEGIRWQDIQ